MGSESLQDLEETFQGIGETKTGISAADEAMKSHCRFADLLGTYWINTT